MVQQHDRFGVFDFTGLNHYQCFFEVNLNNFDILLLIGVAATFPNLHFAAILRHEKVQNLSHRAGRHVGFKNLFYLVDFISGFFLRLAADAILGIIFVGEARASFDHHARRVAVGVSR